MRSLERPAAGPDVPAVAAGREPAFLPSKLQVRGSLSLGCFGQTLSTLREPR